MRITSITPMKDEAPFILEWIAYHQLIGVNDMIVFSNDCTDGTDMMLERLDELGIVRHLTNPSVFNKRTEHHRQATRYVNTLARLKRSDWVVSFDLDEFICVNVGEGTLQDLFAAVDGANVITMNQEHFGSGGLDAYEDKLVIDQFAYGWAYERSYNNTTIPRRGTKTLTHKSANASFYANHSPNIDEADLPGVKYVNGSGAPLDSRWLLEDVKVLHAPYCGYDLVQLNHYVIKSAESFLVQVDRGHANDVKRDIDVAYWRKHDNNHVHDTRIQRWSDRVAQAVAQLRKDPELDALHNSAVQHHKDRIAALLDDPESSKVYRRIRRYNAKNPGIVPFTTSDP
jgi:hypothetical protein